MARHIARRVGQRRPRVVWIVLLVLWIAFIWINSFIPGSTSSVESMFFVRFVSPIFNLFGVHDVELMNAIVRKGAHFSEYFVLAILAVIGLQPRIEVPLFPAVLTVALGVIVPCLDEFIQAHVPGRVGALTDVLIDLAGFIVGALIALAIRAYHDAREQAIIEHEQKVRRARAAKYRKQARLIAYERSRKRNDEQQAFLARNNYPGSPSSRPLYTPLREGHNRRARIHVEPDDNRRRFKEATRL